MLEVVYMNRKIKCIHCNVMSDQSEMIKLTDYLDEENRYKRCFTHPECLDDFLHTQTKEYKTKNHFKLMREIINKNELKEYILENFIRLYPHLIEEGIVINDHQYEVKSGRIDLLARDVKNKLVIIELKVVDDCKDLVYQCAYYPTQFDESVRVVTICPDYKDNIMLALSKLGYVEMKKYQINELTGLFEIVNI